MPRCASNRFPTGQRRLYRSRSQGTRAAGRTLSVAVQVNLPKADGFLFAPRFTGDLRVAVPERAFSRLLTGHVAALVRHADFLDAVDAYGVGLTGPST